MSTQICICYCVVQDSTNTTSLVECIDDDDDERNISDSTGEMFFWRVTKNTKEHKRSVLHKLYTLKIYNVRYLNGNENNF